MVQARFEGNSTLAASFASQALGVTPSSGYAIIVTGKASDNSLLDMHTATTDSIYATLVNKRGFLASNINYLKSTTSAAVTKQQIQDAITVWAKGKLAASPAPLYVIMIDHGTPSGFVLGSETLTPNDLAGWINTLEADPAVVSSGVLTNYKRNIIIGSCYSGIFAPVLSKAGRVIITSASADEQSIAGFSIYNSATDTTISGGEYFIDNLFNYLARGDNLKDAFVMARDMVELRDPRKVPAAKHADTYDTLAQHPLMDDTGTGPSYILQGTTGDSVAKQEVGVGIRTLGNPADITKVTDTTTIATTQTGDTPLWLQVNDNSRIAKAWMEIRTPITAVSSNGGSGQVIPRLLTLPLYYDGLQWNGSYNFPNAGKYNILYYTQDNQTNDIAPAKNSVVYKQLASNTAPSSFTLTSPNDEEGVSGMFLLGWQNVTSANKVTYTLHVSTDQNFTTEVYKEENIPQNATYMPSDAIKDPKTNKYYCQNGDSYCYWKITAIDSYGASTDSNTRSFTVVSTNALPSIIKGFVRDSINAAPIAGAKVDTGTATTSTLSNGAYLMTVPTGTVNLTASASGYQPQTLNNITATAGKITSNDVNLTPAAGSNGVCGTSDKGTFTTAPTANLCTYSGATPSVTGSGPWSWICTGTNGGTNASCSANVYQVVCPAVMDPVCGVNGKTYSNSCEAGVVGVTVAHSGVCKPGDCDGNGTVTIAEVQSAINMFLGLKTVEVCVDQDSNSSVSIAEVQKVINSFLGL